MNLAFLPSLPLRTPTPRLPKQTIRANLQTPPQTRPSPFGRGLQYPRRPVSLKELTRLKIPPPPIDPPLSEKTLTLTIGTFTLASLTLPLLTSNFEPPLAAAAATVLATWAADTLALQGRLSSAAALIAGGRERVATHEAGHFIVAYLLGVRPVEWRLPTASGVLRNERMGVGVERCMDVYRLAAIGMGGVAGEVVRYGRSEGGAVDMAEVGRVVQMVDEGRRGDIVRWGLLQATGLLRVHKGVLLRVAEVMEGGGGVEECVKVIEEVVKEEDLAVRRYELED